MPLLFLKGFLIGLAIAAPVGAIGVLCIQRSLHHGFKIGFMTGLGAAFADGTYGVIAATGLTVISSFLITYQYWIQLLGGIFLLYLGIKLFFTKPLHQQATSNNERSAMHALFTTFILTLMNPSTILSFIAIFAGLGIGAAKYDLIQAFSLVLGITIGSAAWWLVLSGTVALIFHHFLDISIMWWINRCAGIIIFLFGIIALWIK
jgi:threonine/homoserine/homoserine lactone efflux protein